MANREALLEQIDAYQNELKLLQEMLKNNEGAALEQAFSEARSVRENWLKSKD